MKPARLGIEEVTHSDRISRLPEDLLFRILSLIPVSDAMSTSLLSKRWKSVWKMMPTLEYDEESCPNIGSLGFDQFCGRSLQLHEAPLLKTLNLKLREKSVSLDSLLFPNIRSTLLEITLTSTCYPYYSPISFPSNLKVFQTLVVLKLEGYVLLDVVKSPVCFKSLKSMHLNCVKFSCEESFCKLLSACPVLEDLFLQRLCTVGRFLFTISVPSLQRLFITIEDAYSCYDDPKIKINAPSLRYLMIFDRKCRFSLVEDMPELVEANVSVKLTKNGKLLKGLASAEHLLLDSYPSMVPLLTDRLVSKSLLHLELIIYDDFRSNLLRHLLNDIPNLQSLKLNHTRPNYNKDQPCSVSEPSSVPVCLSFHLETLQWIGYAGTYEETKAAGYVLKNARCLKNATISLHLTVTENGPMMIKELKSMPKASTLCQLSIE